MEGAVPPNYPPMHKYIKWLIPPVFPEVKTTLIYDFIELIYSKPRNFL